MAAPTDPEIIAHWKGELAPLLGALQAFHDRDGYLSEAALLATAAGLGIPLADLYGTVTFYHHFSREGPGQHAPRVCTGNVCSLRGGRELLEALRSEGATAMPCSGRCDDPVPVLRGRETWVGTAPDNLERRPSRLPDLNPGGCEECAFAAIRERGRSGLEGYLRTGGYAALEKALAELEPESVVGLMTESGLTGRGGAQFPTGVKWKAVWEAPGRPKYVVCNADEGEPGCFKDRALMDYDPHAVLEGMALAGYACGASDGVIYLRYEYPETCAILAQAIAEAETGGWLGDDVRGSGFSFRVHLRRGAGAYICGEETSLLNSLEGKHPFPRNKPPFPVTHGLNGLPTAVNNVETLVNVPPIVLRGAAWYRGLGIGEHAGTKIISLSGDVRLPGNYEIPIGLPLRTLLYDWAGGPPEGRAFQAVTMAGLSGGFVGASAIDDVTLDDPCLRARGSFLGAGGIIVFDDSRDMVEAAREAMEFFAHESCGKCFPCRIGTMRLSERLSGDGGPADTGAWTAEVLDIGDVMKATSACGLGLAAPLVTESLLRYFPAAVESHRMTRRT